MLQELTGLFAQLANVDAQLQSSRAVLNALLHRPPNAPIGRPDHDLEEVSAGLVLDDLLAAAAGNPTLAAADAAIGREQARVESERHEAKPDFTVMAEWWTADDGMGGRFERYALLATVTLLWVNKRSYSAAVSQARAQKLAAIAERQARFDEVRRDIAAAWHRVTASERIGELYRTTLLPQSETTLAAAQSAYETDQAPFVSVIDAERDLLLNRLGLARAEADLGIGIADLAEALGVVRLPDEEVLR